MAAPSKADTRVRAKIAAIHRALTAIDHLASGTIAKRMRSCGNPNCRCARGRQYLHGPYYQWGYMKDGKLHSRVLSPQQAELMSQAIANYRKVKRLLKSWEDQTVRWIERHATD
jgi:uncharacterized protein DUF6788